MKVFRMLQESARKFRLQIISISLIVLTILIFCRQDFLILANEAVQNEAMSHIILVPLLASFLVYRKKDLVKAALAVERLGAETKIISLSEIVGIALCLSAFLLYWHGFYTFYSLEYHIFSLVIFLMGITLVLFNVKTLIALIFPILFFLFLGFPPTPVIFSAGAALGNFNSQASYTLLRIVGLPVSLSTEFGSPAILVNNPSSGANALEFTIDPSCSGIYSLVAFTMFAAFLVYIARGSTTKKIALFPIGFITLMTLNIVRISLVVFIAYQFGRAIAMAMFHLFSGWFLIFFGMLLLLLITEKFLHLRLFAGEKKSVSVPKCDHTVENKGNFCLYCGNFCGHQRIRLTKRFWTKITALLLFTYIATLIIQAPVFAFAQRLTISDPNPEACAEVFPPFIDAHTRYEPVFLSRYREFEKISGQDASLLYVYMSNTSDPNVYMLVGVASSRDDLHGWEVCYFTFQITRGLPPLAIELDSGEVQLMEDPPITAQFLVFEHPDNYTQVTLYWYLRALFKTGMTIEPRYVRISLIIFTKDPRDYLQFEPRLLSIGQYIASYWEPLKAQSLASLGIPTMQVLLGSTILVAVILQTTQYTKERIRKTANLKLFERLASPNEKTLYKTIKELSQKTKETTAQNIASAFEKATDKAAKPNELINMLGNLEKTGITKADIINIEGQPTLVWKP